MPIWKIYGGARVSFFNICISFPELLSAQVFAVSSAQLLKPLALKLEGEKVLSI